jgi:hypothetical protein
MDEVCVMSIVVTKYVRGDVFFYINILKNYQRMLIEDINSCVDHDGD